MTLRGGIALAMAALLAMGGWILTGAAQTPAVTPAPSGSTQVATFAAGCFWCAEAAFDSLDGVVKVTSGYTGGHVPNPSYTQVSAGGTGHYEAVQVVFDPAKIRYDRLLYVFWRNIDPLQADGQFCDRGDSYRSAIFIHDAAQRAAAEHSKAALDASKRFDRPIVTEILEAGPFYPAEDYHQRYHRKHAAKYAFYRYGCGRDAQLNRRWGAEARAEQ